MPSRERKVADPPGAAALCSPASFQGCLAAAHAGRRTLGVCVCMPHTGKDARLAPARSYATHYCLDDVHKLMHYCLCSSTVKT